MFYYFHKLIAKMLSISLSHSPSLSSCLFIYSYLVVYIAHLVCKLNGLILGKTHKKYIFIYPE